MFVSLIRLTGLTAQLVQALPSALLVLGSISTQDKHLREHIFFCVWLLCIRSRYVKKKVFYHLLYLILIVVIVQALLHLDGAV